MLNFFFFKSTIFFYPLQGFKNAVKREKQAVKPENKLAKEQNHIWTADYNIHQGVTILVSEGTENDQPAYPKIHCCKIIASVTTTMEYIFPFLVWLGLNQV